VDWAYESQLMYFFEVLEILRKIATVSDGSFK
jgi:hypothetical protein